MKKIKVLITLIIIGFTINVNGQINTVDGNGGDGDELGDVYADGTIANATASAKLLVAMKIVQTTGLNFGSIVLNGSTGGTVVFAADGNNTGRVFTSGLQRANDAADAPELGLFTITGSHSEGYALTLPVSGEIAIQHTLFSTANANENMTIDALTVKFANKDYNAGALRISALNLLGDDTITLGGTLNVSPSQKAGTYTGQFTISVDYN
jgi:hypothetical protein